MKGINLCLLVRLEVQLYEVKTPFYSDHQLARFNNSSGGLDNRSGGHFCL